MKNEIDYWKNLSEKEIKTMSKEHTETKKFKKEMMHKIDKIDTYLKKEAGDNE